MNALQEMDRFWKEVIQVSTQKNDLKASVSVFFPKMPFSQQFW